MKRVTITSKGKYNIVRTEGRNKTIFRSNLDGATAKQQLKHWKAMARNSGGRVYFNAVPVPKDLAASVTPIAA